VEAINKTFDPISVLPKSLVPLLIVTYSLIIVLSPILVNVFSPSYFKSWGTSPMELEWKILQLSPIMVSQAIVTLLPM
jgi:hypothetical protein|tara:strand:- start:3004 stop:3237 length:234 start_codon:yes stop_codon:yes gene_type:complete